MWGQGGHVPTTRGKKACPPSLEPPHLGCGKMPLFFCVFKMPLFPLATRLAMQASIAADPVPETGMVNSLLVCQVYRSMIRNMHS